MQKKMIFFHPKMSECQYFGLKSCLERQRKKQAWLLALQTCPDARDSLYVCLDLTLTRLVPRIYTQPH